MTGRAGWVTFPNVAEALPLGEMIKAARIRHGVTQAQLAAACHISKTLVYDWEQNKELPAERHLPTLARLLPSLDEGELAVARAEALAEKTRARALAEVDAALANTEAVRARYGL